MCIIKKPSKSLNPQAQEWRPTPPAAALKLPRILFPSDSHCPQQVVLPSAASPSYPVLPLFSPQQPCFYHSSPLPCSPGAVFHYNACPPGIVISFPSYERLNHAEKATGFFGVDDQANIRHHEEIEISMEEAGIAKRTAERSFSLGKKLMAKREWKIKTSPHIADDSGGGAPRHPPRSSATVFQQQKTTVMIKNVPNQIGRNFMLRFLDDYCKAYRLEYDFLYLPMDFRTENNLGYAFVNFTAAAAALQFKKLLQNHKWEVVSSDSGPINSKKICEVRWARIQGKEALINRFRNSSFRCSRMDFLPAVLDPPRNGLNPDHSTLMVIGELQGS